MKAGRGLWGVGYGFTGRWVRLLSKTTKSGQQRASSLPDWQQGEGVQQQQQQARKRPFCKAAEIPMLPPPRFPFPQFFLSIFKKVFKERRQIRPFCKQAETPMLPSPQNFPQVFLLLKIAARDFPQKLQTVVMCSNFCPTAVMAFQGSFSAVLLTLGLCNWLYMST